MSEYEGKKKHFEHKPGKGSIFPNDRKERDTHPDLRGDGKVETVCPHCRGSFTVSMWVNAWKNYTRQDNTPYVGMTFHDKTLPTEKNMHRVGHAVNEPAKPRVGQPWDDELKDRVPF